MRFVERILSEINHRIVYAVCGFFIYAVCHTALYATLLISVHKALALCVDDILLLLAHGTADVVRLSHCIARELLHYLHNLLLVYYTTVGRL